MSDSDDDPIVSQIPVYLSQEMKNQLYLFQYPSKPRNSTGEPPQIQKCMIKPQNKQVKMELAVNPNSNYDYGKGEYMALNVDGPSSSKDGKIFKSGLLDKTVLESTCPVPDAGRYAIGVLHAGELHLNPLYTCVEMRNYLPFLDTGDKRAKEAAKSREDGEVEEEELKQITVKFARQESERVKRARERSFNYLSKKSAEEPWYSTEFHPYRSEKSECLQARLFCPAPEEKPMQLSLDGEQYRELLAPPEALDDAVYGTLETTMRRLRSRPLVDRVRHLLRSAEVLGFDELMELLEGDEKPMEVVRTLQQVGVLVQGNWVIKSEELYPAEGSYPPGITADALCQARDYMLLQFTRKLCLPMTELQNGARITPSILREIVERLAIMLPLKGWEFKLPSDETFGVRFPEVSQRQQMMWEARMKNM
ncbi:hypothetical protein R5R35_007308 [Gryllus longicercus]|uniref:DNA-directed RNA polymerase III subunit RPC5 n=1 Tax=Gryllus longicercus TaxID=2509291 RepID=A0AAN9VJW6_9ORTH